MTKPTRTVGPVHFEDFDGHQFERLVFAYHLRTDIWQSLEWYGQTGSDLGRDIWGTRENGESVCIQCANRRKVVATKAKQDMDKVVKSCNGVPHAFVLVSSTDVSAAIRDKIKDHAQALGIVRCEIWSGKEFDERLRAKDESLLRRFVNGELFPDDPEKLSRLVGEKIDDALVVERIQWVFDRPAFRTPFHQESSLGPFRQAIGDTIQALNTGIWQTRDGKEIERIPSRHQVVDPRIRDTLAIVVTELADLRAKFEELIRQGEILHCDCKNPDCSVFFFSSRAAREMDMLRDGIVDRIHRLAQPALAPEPARAATISVVNSNNSGIIANQVVIRGRDNRSPVIVSGSLKTDPVKYNYVEYLVKRLFKFRKLGEKYGQYRKSPVTIQSVRSNLEQDFGGLTKDLAVDRFDEVVAKIQAKIDATAQAKRNQKAGHPNYHQFGEHPGNEADE
jgi:hypothetical protein